MSCTIQIPLPFTYIDDGVRLDVLHVWIAEAQLPAPSLGGADDSRGDGVLEGEGAADGHHKLPRPQVRGAAQRQHGQLGLQEKKHKGRAVIRLEAKVTGKQNGVMSMNM